MTLILSGTDGVSDIDGTAATPAIRGTDTNTGIFFPAADTIAFAEGGAEAMRLDSSGNLGLGVTPSAWGGAYKAIQFGIDGVLNATTSTTNGVILAKNFFNNGAGNRYINTDFASFYQQISGQHQWFTAPSGTAGNAITFTQAMTLDASGNLGIGVTPATLLNIRGSSPILGIDSLSDTTATISFRPSGTSYSERAGLSINYSTAEYRLYCGVSGNTYFQTFYTNGTERARITSGGVFCINTTNTTPSASAVAGAAIAFQGGRGDFAVDGSHALNVGRNIDDGNLVIFYQAGVSEGTISVSGNTVSYNGFSGGHWTQLQQGRGYNPEILRGTVMSSIGEMCEWKSVTWTETIEHPAVPAVDAKDAVLDDEGNVIEPAIEAVEGKDAWTETFNKREAYLGNLAVGATFEENGVTKTVVDDGNERLPKVKISDVVGDKAVYGVFQTYDDVQDMLVTSLGAFVVRIAAGVTVQIGDLLESNGDGCAKVQDDDVIRSKTIGKVTSTTPSATYADGSYTVPAVLYCG